MATNVKDLDLVEHGSHYVEVNGYHHGGEKEEVFLYFSASWRGEPVILTMSANRYVHSEGWSEWRIYATDATYGTLTRGDDGERGKHERDYNRGDVTDTARSRLSGQARPMVAAWLDSDEYRESERRAYVECVKREFDATRGYYSAATDRVRRRLAVVAHKISEADAVRIVLACDAFDAFSEAYKAI